MWVCIILFLLYIAMLIGEKQANKRALRSFKAVVHVSGIRGKTSVCRLLDGALREKYRVYTKTTGSQPVALNVAGEEIAVRRLGPANIREQLRTVRRAHREGAEVLVLECMAVNPDLVDTSQNEMLNAGHCVITNARYDHTAELGDTLEEITRSLCRIVPKAGRLYTAEAHHFAIIERACAARGSEAVLCRGEDAEGENRAIAAAIARDLGLTDSEIAAGFARAKTDFGAARLYPMQNSEGAPIRFLNLFSANDPQSSAALLATLGSAAGEANGAPAAAEGNVVFLFNNRWDRPDRAEVFARHFFPARPGARVLVMGGSPSLAVRLFRKAGADAARLRSKAGYLDVPEGTLLVGLGNIEGAHEMVAVLEGGESTWRK